MADKFPKISIITPSFNQGQFIEQTIKSVLDQDYPNIEYIVMDGGSTDNTVKILKKYANKIKWVSEKDKGQADAINKGLKKATGEIIAYINSDDYYLPGTFRNIYKFFVTNPQFKWVTGDYKIVNEKNREIQKYIVWYKKIIRLVPSLTSFKILNYISQPSTFWQKEVFKKIGNFDASLRYVMDYDFMLRVFQHFPVGLINTPLSAFRIHSQSKGGVDYKKQFGEELKIVGKYTRNPLLLTLHKLHNYLIIFAYNILKK